MQQRLLVQEFPLKDGQTLHEWLGEQLQRLVSLEEDYAERIFKSKKRDDNRGSSIVPGYADVHVSAEDDPVISSARADAQKLKETVDTILAQT